jgi:hypothetical protein
LKWSGALEPEANDHILGGSSNPESRPNVHVEIKNATKIHGFQFTVKHCISWLNIVLHGYFTGTSRYFTLPLVA